MIRLPALDGLRAVAILIVMVSHAGLGHIVPGGFGVTIFFFLSGYLITTLMIIEWQQSSRINLKSFYIRRSFRIMPPMWLAISLTVLMANANLIPELNPEFIIFDLLFLTNYTTFDSNVPIPLWSLDVEEHFYLFFPILFIAIMSRTSATGSAIFCAILSIIVLCIRIFTFNYTDAENNIYYWSHTRLDSILFGAILACWNNPSFGDEAVFGCQRRYFIAGLAIILITLIMRDEFFRETFRYTLQGVGLFFIFNFCLRSDGLVSYVLSRKYFRFIADLSYFLYLIHFPMLIAMDTFSKSPVVKFVGAMALSFAIAWLVRVFLEIPLHSLRKRFEAKPQIKVSQG